MVIMKAVQLKNLKMHKTFPMTSLLLVILPVLVMNACSRDAGTKIPTITTATTSSITQITAKTGGNILSDGGAPITARGVCWSTSANPSLELTTQTFDGTGTGTFASSISGLSSNTTYYVRAYASNDIGTAYGNKESFTTSPGGLSGTVTDIEGNIYNTVIIGSQIWMGENLKTTMYNDGTPINCVTDNMTWITLTTAAYCDFNNDPAFSSTYGRLYNWYAVDINEATSVASNGGKNVCPTGWHVPSDADWNTLITFLGGEQVAGGKLKEAGTTHWGNPNLGATNETGFTAIPGGYRGNMGGYSTYIRDYANFWNSTGYSSAFAWTIGLVSQGTYLWIETNFKSKGYSVRCIKD